MAHFKRNWRTAVGGLTLALVLGAYGFLVPIWHRQTMQAAAGQRARDTQCARDPISVKLLTAAAKYPSITHITASDLTKYKRAAPKGCARPKHP